MSKVDIERVLTQGNPDGLTQEQIKQAIDDTVREQEAMLPFLIDIFETNTGVK